MFCFRKYEILILLALRLIFPLFQISKQIVLTHVHTWNRSFLREGKGKDGEILDYQSVGGIGGGSLEWGSLFPSPAPRPFPFHGMHTWRSWFARLRMRQNSSCFRENVLTYLSTRIFVKSDCGDSSCVKLPKSVILGKIIG